MNGLPQKMPQNYSNKIDLKVEKLRSDISITINGKSNTDHTHDLSSNYITNRYARYISTDINNYTDGNTVQSWIEHLYSNILQRSRIGHFHDLSSGEIVNKLASTLSTESNGVTNGDTVQAWLTVYSKD